LIYTSIIKNILNELQLKKSKNNKEIETNQKTKYFELDMFNKNFVNNPSKILNLDLHENEAFLNLENQQNIDKSFLDNRFSYIIDNNNFSNNILFHLELVNHNENSGLTQNEINLVTAFMGREKSIGRILTNMKNANLIKNTPMREGRKYEFLYSIKNRDVLPKYLFKISQYYKSKRYEYEKDYNLDTAIDKDEYLDDIIVKENEKNNFLTEDELLDNKKKINNKKNEKTNEIAVELRKNSSEFENLISKLIKEKSDLNKEIGQNLLHMVNSSFFNFNENNMKNKNEVFEIVEDPNQENFLNIKRNFKKILNKKSFLIKDKNEKSDEDSNFLSDFKIQSDIDPTINNKSKENKTKNSNNQTPVSKEKKPEEKNKLKYSLLQSEINSNLTYKTKCKYSPSSNTIITNLTEDVEFVDLNKHDFLFIFNKILCEVKYKSILTQFEIDIKIENFEKINRDKNLKKNILLDFFHKNSDILNLKSLSFISFNRYLFCLNKLNEYNLLLAINLKHLIIDELEKKTGYSIDRKTLQKILSNLHKLDLIKVMEYELIMKNLIYHYSNNRSEIKQNKIIAMRRDIVENKELYEVIEFLIKPKCQSKNNNFSLNEYKYVTLPGFNHTELVKNLKVKCDNNALSDYDEICNINNNKRKSFINNHNIIKISKNKLLIEEENFKNSKKIDLKVEENGKTLKDSIKDYNCEEIYNSKKKIDNQNSENYINTNFIIGFEKNSKLKINSKQNSLYKLIAFTENKINGINELDYKLKFFNNFKKLYFVKKNLHFIFDNYNYENKNMKISENRSIFDLKIKNTIRDDNSQSTNDNIIIDKNSKNQFQQTKNIDFFLNLFFKREDYKKIDNYPNNNIGKNILSSDYNYTKTKVFGIDKEIPLFRFIENHRGNEIIIPKYLKDKIFNNYNNDTNNINSISSEKNKINSFEKKESFENVDNNKGGENFINPSKIRSNRHVIYSSCLLSNEDIEKEKTNLYYFNLDDFIKNSFKTEILNLDDKEKIYAKTFFRNNEDQIHFKNNINNQNICDNNYLLFNTNKKVDEDKRKRISKENENFIIELLKNKKKRDNSDVKKYKKLVDFYSVLSYIYFNPRTTLKKIKKVFKYNEMFSDLIIYFAKLDLIQLNFKRITDNLNKKLLLKDHDIELILDENVTNFIEIN